MRLSSNAVVTGLYAYGRLDPGAQFFRRFYELIADQLQKLEIAPTYVAVDGYGFSGKMTKLGGNSHRRLLSADFKNISGLSVIANPPGSDEPAFDHFFYANVGFVESDGELCLCHMINESFETLGSEIFENSLRELVQLFSWDFGFAFVDAVEKRPDFHVLGISTGQLSRDEQHALETWYSATPDQRNELLRSVYSYNILNERHLARQLPNGVSLRHFIEERCQRTLQRIGDNGVYLWKVLDDSQREQLRLELKGLSALIA